MLMIWLVISTLFFSHKHTAHCTLHTAHRRREINWGILLLHLPIWLSHKRDLERGLKNRESQKKGAQMEKALTKVGSFWISKKAKEEISNITEDLSVCLHSLPYPFLLVFQSLFFLPLLHSSWWSWMYCLLGPCSFSFCNLDIMLLNGEDPFDHFTKS